MLLSDKSLQVGGWGPMRRTGKRPKKTGFYRSKFVRVKLTSAAQVARAKTLLDEENAERTAEATQVRNYPKRPFMGPTLQEVAPRLPKQWKDSVRG